ncbi:PPM-type phosphatase domain-containing protein [Mycena chlorophos]|uniref:PPM-type phosphatase domain-containing protein n=1 Tax=Mycena chlorophos TaxID=658473 RepID=A0A8H6SA89_MYCCL|nr:PPM-type phosphatase domain-containing protein [Mycena chlorophos]
MASGFSRRVLGRFSRRHYYYAFGGLGASATTYAFRSSRTDGDSGRVEETSFGSQPGVSRVDRVCIPSNSPCEDQMTSLSIPSSDWSFWGIYDGHVGPQTSRLLERDLIPNVVDRLHDLYDQKPKPETSDIHDAFKKACLDLDDEIVNQSAALVRAQPEGSPRMTLAASVLQAARAGSCALVAFYEANLRRLHVAVVGDSRAVLGRPHKTADGKTVYDLHVLSLDQNAKNPAEAARLLAAHPDEANLMNQEKGRLLGWGITRAFGDGVMKWSKELQTWMDKEILGDRPRPTLLTPPYFTAEPEVTTIEVQPGDFMVMASDGMWDQLTSEEAVGLVGKWIERWGSDNTRQMSFWSEEVGQLVHDGPGFDRTDLPVKITDDETVYRRWDVKKKFTNVDSLNAASHLARNALGGANRDLHDALVGTPAPRAHHIRDDISIYVVFFD